MSFSAFYDANVLIPHEIRDISMISAEIRLHAVYWSEGEFEEWLRNATEKNLTAQEKVLKFQSDLNEMYPHALISRARYSRLIDSMTNNEKDRLRIQLAWTNFRGSRQLLAVAPAPLTVPRLRHLFRRHFR